MATKPKSKQSLKLGKGKLKLWYLIPAIALVAIVGVIVVRMSGASGRVWTPNDPQFKYQGDAVLKTKTNGTKYVTARAAVTTGQASGTPETTVALLQDLPAGTKINAHSICTNVDVGAPGATIMSGGGTVAFDASNNPISSRFDSLTDKNQRTAVYKQGFNRICVPISSQITASRTYLVAGLVVKAGAINIANFREMNNSTTDQVWSSYLFLDGATANAGKLIPESEFVSVPANSTNKVWNAKKGRSAYVNISAFGDSSWPGTKYCADIKGVAPTSQVRMDGSVSVLNQAMGGAMTAQTIRVAKDASGVVCTTTQAQTGTNDYVISPTVKVITGEVQVLRIYKKQ